MFAYVLVFLCTFLAIFNCFSHCAWVFLYVLFPLPKIEWPWSIDFFMVQDDDTQNYQNKKLGEYRGMSSFDDVHPEFLDRGCLLGR